MSNIIPFSQPINDAEINIFQYRTTELLDTAQEVSEYINTPMDFPDKWAAIVWMCQNQLGRRSITDEQRTYLIGKQYEAQKRTQGTNNQYAQASSEKPQNGDFHFESTAEAVAADTKTSKNTEAFHGNQYVSGDGKTIQHQTRENNLEKTSGLKNGTFIQNPQCEDSGQTAIIGEAYKAQKLSFGGDRKSSAQNEHLNGARTSDVVAKKQLGENHHQANSQAMGVSLIDVA